MTVAHVSGGHPSSRAAAQRRLPASTLGGARPNVLDDNSLLLIAVPDDALTEEVSALSSIPIAAGARVAHLSGCHGVSILSPLHARGAVVCAFHPLCSLPTRESEHAMEGAVVAYEALGGDVEFWLGLARDMGCQPVRLPDEDRAAYHMAAALMGNGVQSLLDLAFRQVERTPDNQAIRQGLVHLARGAMQRAAGSSPGEALTGPVARGDHATLDAHWRTLQNDGDRALVLQVVRALERLGRRDGITWEPPTS